MSLAPALRVLTATLVAFLLLSARALAADGEQTPLDLGRAEPARQAAGPGGGELLRTIFALAIVVAVIYGLYWVLKRVKASREELASGTALRALASLPLGPGRALHLVRAGDEVVLLGVAEGGVSPIRHYREPEARALGLLDDGAQAEAQAWLPVPASPVTPSPAPGGGWASRALEALRRRTTR